MLATKWKTSFLSLIRQREYAASLQAASLEGKQEWTRAITAAVVANCQQMGWQAAARDHVLNLLPIARSEYLNIDVTAFTPGNTRWLLPTAVIELENQQDDSYIAYNLWKLLCVRADLRIVYCYRRQSEEGRDLVTFLMQDVIASLSNEQRLQLQGATMVVVGSYAESETFPYGFFRWWLLDANIGRFDVM